MLGQTLNTLGKKIGSGFFALAILLAISILATINKTKEIDEISERNIALRAPTSNASSLLLIGINTSNNLLSSRILTDSVQSQSTVASIWENSIYPALAQLEKLSPNWTDPDNVERFTKLKPKISKLGEYQAQAEQLIRTDRKAASNLYETEIIQISDEIQSLINAMWQRQGFLAQNDLEAAQKGLNRLITLGWILLSLGLVICLLLTIFITRSITKPINQSVSIAQKIGQGELSVPIEIRGGQELQQLGAALVNMRNSLQKRATEVEQFEWHTIGQNSLYEIMRGEKLVTDLANDIIGFLAKYLNCSIGTIYLSDDHRQQLLLVGSYSLDPNKALNKIEFGEGLLGQSAKDKELKVLNLKNERFTVKSSIIQADPEHILIAPLIFDNRTLGTLELASFEPISNEKVKFIKSCVESISIAIYSTISQEKVLELLEETQQQSEELQQQQQELEKSNAELEEQTQKLKEQQEELQVANEELEEQTQIVEQKNQDLESARTDIEQKAKQLEITSKYKSEFLANMSHELRTPLNSLLILANDLVNNKEENLTEEQIESTQIIAKSGYDLLTLINEILDLSKIESGKMDLNIGEFLIKDIADDLDRNFRRLAAEKKLPFKVSVAEGLPELIRTDKTKLEQVLKNLVSNAIKFTEKGEVTVSFESADQSSLDIYVKDTGIGIAEDKKEVVFEAFQQVDGGTARKYGGTGLGLSISREITKLLNGTLTLSSELGKGSTFLLNIPMALTSDGKPTHSIVTEQKPHVNRQDFLDYPGIPDQREIISEEDHKVLIIEDDLNFSKILCQQASSKGFKYLAATTGEDGLSLAIKHQPHAIILDLELPGMDGHMVLKELKGNPLLRHIPVHVVSSHTKTIDPLKHGAVEFLAKPLSMIELNGAFQRIEDFIHRKMKNLLIVEDDKNLRKSIVKLIGNGDVKCIEAGTAKEALEQFDKETIDCMVLDIGLPDLSGFELIKSLEERTQNNLPPIIIYTGKELSKEEAQELDEYAETIIIKGVKSEERLLDETALFLHRTVKKLPTPKQKIINSMYNMDTMFIGKKVLLVDDDMRNVFALSKILKDKGFTIIKAENGQVALNELADNPDMDIVLMDIMMPEMDGYQCIGEIRRQQKFRSLPIIAITAKAMKDDRKKCIDAGANDYITKPVDVERLISLMRIWINK